MSKGKRDTYTSGFKPKVASEAINGDKTMVQLASEYRVSHFRSPNGRKQMKGGASAVFGFLSKRQKHENVNEVDLMEKVGCLMVELDWLKKSLQLGISLEKLNF